MENLTYRDYLLMPILTKIALFADAAEKAIAKHYEKAFGIGKPEIEVYSNSSTDNRCYAMLSIDGVWKWHDEWGGGRNFSLKCTSEEIFKLYETYIKSGYKEPTADSALFDFLYWVKKMPGMDKDVEELLNYLREESLKAQYG